MGGSSSKAVKRISTLISNGGADENDQKRSNARRLTSLATPFVLTRWGSMYIDEDGDVAHEFYEESISNVSHKAFMKKITANLRPQGEVPHEYPRLNVDLPIIICER